MVKDSATTPDNSRGLDVNASEVKVTKNHPNRRKKYCTGQRRKKKSKTDPGYWSNMILSELSKKKRKIIITIIIK